MCFSEFFIRIFVVYITLTTIVHLQIWSAANITNPVCNTVECKKLGDMYKKNINSFGNPCNNFYDYVCHGWGQQFPKPKTAESWNVAQMIQYKVFDDLKKMIEDKTVTNDTSFEATKALHRACLNTPYLERSNPQNLRKIINSIAVWPIMYPKDGNPSLDFHCWAVDQLYIKLTGESAFFDFNFIIDKLDPRRPVVELVPLRSPYGALIRNTEWNKAELNKYKYYLGKLIAKVAPPNQNLSVEIVDSDLYATLQFREALRQIIERTSSENNQRLLLKMFQNSYNKEAKSQLNAEINWLFMLRAINKAPQDPDGMKVSENTTVYVNEKYFAALANLLGNTQRRIIVNHIHLYFLERHIQHDPSLITILKDCVSVGIRPSGVIRYPTERWLHCLENNNHKAPLANLYFQTSLTEKKKAAVAGIIDEAKAVLGNQISTSNWLDTETLNKAKDKVNKLRRTIGYTERAPVSGLDSIKVFACYIAASNQIYVTTAFLESPMYTENVPFEIQYGSTMSVLGHELYHAFDRDSILYNGNGGFAPWPIKVNGIYSDQTECFTELFRVFKEKQLKKHDLCWATDLAAETIDEDMSDAMGLKLAYQAYRNKLKANNGNCAVLPGFEKFSCDQMFFIAYGNTLCDTSSINTQERQLICDIHSRLQVRVNAAVANMKEFSEAFQCKPKDLLNIQKRCDLWKR